jgi:tetratricopeptide (TPR) repeat protein
MTQIIFILTLIISAFIFSVSAQTPDARQAFASGIKSANQGEFQTALKQFQVTLEFVKNEQRDNLFRAKIHFNIGVCYYKLKMLEKASIEYERAILLNPNYEKAFYALGMANAELKNWQTAEQAFSGAIRINKRNGETWFDLAFVYLAQNDYDAAQKAFEKSIKLKSVDSAISHNNIGVILAMNGDVNAAIKEFETALRKSDGNLTVAQGNLEFCKSLDKNTFAKLEFSEKNIRL